MSISVHILTPFLDFPLQIPPMTPGTTKKVSEALRLTYANWSERSRVSGIPTDPEKWSIEQVTDWLTWTMIEFSLKSEAYDRFLRDFKVRKQQICVVFATSDVFNRSCYPRGTCACDLNRTQCKDKNPWENLNCFQGFFLLMIPRWLLLLQ